MLGETEVVKKFQFALMRVSSSRMITMVRSVEESIVSIRADASELLEATDA